MPHHAGQRHVGAGDGVHGADHVALDAGDLHQPCHRVAYQTFQVGQRHRQRLGALLGGAALQIHQRGGGHAAGGAHLCLASTLGARQGGTGRDDLAKPGRNIQRPADGVLAGPPGPPQRKQDGGQNAAAPRRGRGHNALHAGVAFGGFQRLRHDLGQISVSQQSAADGCGLHFGGIAPGKPAVGTVRPAVIVAGLNHHLPQTAHFGQGLGAAQSAFQQVTLQNDLPQRLIVLLAGVQHGTN